MSVSGSNIGKVCCHTRYIRRRDYTKIPYCVRCRFRVGHWQKFFRGSRYERKPWEKKESINSIESIMM